MILARRSGHIMPAKESYIITQLEYSNYKKLKHEIAHVDCVN